VWPYERGAATWCMGCVVAATLPELLQMQNARPPNGHSGTKVLVHERLAKSVVFSTKDGPCMCSDKHRWWHTGR